MRHVAIAFALLLVGCKSRKSGQSAPSSDCKTFEVETFINEHRVQYVDAIVRARRWLDALDIDPIELRKHGVKGKKKLTEQIDAYSRLLQVAPAADVVALRERIQRVVAITYEPRFHDLADLSDKRFKQEATSYLRAAFLMARTTLSSRYGRPKGRDCPTR